MQYKNALIISIAVTVVGSSPMWLLVLRTVLRERRVIQRLRRDMVKTFRNDSFENVTLATFSKYRLIRKAAKQELARRHNNAKTPIREK